MRRYKIFMVLLALGISNSVPIAFAQSPKGSLFSFSSSASTAYSFENNLYRSETNKVSDSRMSVSPVFKISYMPKRYVISTLYTANYGRSFEHSEEDLILHNLSLSGSTDPAANFVVKSAYSYVY